jgi:hypothetical protein
MEKSHKTDWWGEKVSKTLLTTRKARTIITTVNSKGAVDGPYPQRQFLYPLIFYNTKELFSYTNDY